MISMRTLPFKYKKNKTKVGFLYNHGYFLGGGEVSFYELIKNLDKNRFKPVVMVPEHGEIKEKLLNKKIEVYISKIPPLKNYNIFLQLKSFFNLVKLIKKNEIDILHINGQRASFYGVIAAKLTGIPAIWHVRETKKDLLLYEIFLAFMSKAIICVSKSVFQKRLFHLKTIIRDKLYIVYNGVDTNYFKKELSVRDEVRSSLAVNGNVLFGVVGNIIPLKGQDFFVKGIAAARIKRPDLKIKCILIGRSLDNSYHKYLMTLLRKNNLEHDICILQYEKNIKNIFSALDVFVLPSKREGFSRSLLEAMSLKLPIIATRISEIEEAVIDKKNAILVEYNHIDEMANAIVKIYDESKLRSQMGLNNRNRVKDNFDIIHHILQIQTLYDKLSN